MRRLGETVVVVLVMGGVVGGGNPSGLGWSLLALMAVLAVALPLHDRRANRRRRPDVTGLVPAPRQELTSARRRTPR